MSKRTETRAGFEKRSGSTFKTEVFRNGLPVYRCHHKDQFRTNKWERSRQDGFVSKHYLEMVLRMRLRLGAEVKAYVHHRIAEDEMCPLFHISDCLPRDGFLPERLVHAGLPSARYEVNPTMEGRIRAINFIGDYLNRCP